MNHFEKTNSQIKIETTDEQIPGIDDLPEISQKNTSLSKVKIVYSYDKKSKKRCLNDFVKYFNLRYKGIESILKQRPELQTLSSINKLKFKEERETVSIIGMIREKNFTKNDNCILLVEDLSGQISVLIHKNNEEAYALAKDLVLDEVIGITGSLGKNIIFSNKIVFPDIPINREIKKGTTDNYAIFISDLHVGSKVFLEKEFEKFIRWLEGSVGNEEQLEISKKVKYLFLTGDLVEGVSVYPNQDKDLDILNITEQYEYLTKYLSRIRKDIKIIICPGNHDAGRIAEPQQPLYNEFAESLLTLPNVILVSNPAMVNIDSSDIFQGLDVLLYHGYSLIYYSNNVESIRAAGGQKRADLIMKFLLQRRHLAPTHESNMYVPDAEEDPLIISKIPDIFVTGHIHRATVSQYGSISLLNTSCWVAITEDQEKRGLEPQPARVFALNIQTRKIKVINFFGQQ